MPSLNIFEIMSIDLEIYNNFVETGTHIGDTIFNLQEHFKKCYTVELTKACYDWCVEKNKNENTKFYLGPTEEKLGEIIQELDGPTLFFLDAHYSCGDTSLGPNICPLYQEIDEIMKFKHKCCIIIDDFRMFGTKFMPVTKEKIMEKVKSRFEYDYNFPSVFADNDRWVIYLSRIAE